MKSLIFSILVLTTITNCKKTNDNIDRLSLAGEYTVNFNYSYSGTQFDTITNTNKPYYFGFDTIVDVNVVTTDEANADIFIDNLINFYTNEAFTGGEAYPRLEDNGDLFYKNDFTPYTAGYLRNDSISYKMRNRLGKFISKTISINGIKKK